jgi:hypothetical protein
MRLFAKGGSNCQEAMLRGYYGLFIIRRCFDFFTVHVSMKTNLKQARRVLSCVPPLIRVSATFGRGYELDFLFRGAVITANEIKSEQQPVAVSALRPFSFRVLTLGFGNLLYLPLIAAESKVQHARAATRMGRSIQFMFAILLVV